MDRASIKETYRHDFSLHITNLRMRCSPKIICAKIVSFVLNLTTCVVLTNSIWQSLDAYSSSKLTKSRYNVFWAATSRISIWDSYYEMNSEIHEPAWLKTHILNFTLKLLDYKNKDL